MECKHVFQEIANHKSSFEIIYWCSKCGTLKVRTENSSKDSVEYTYKFYTPKSKHS